MSKRRQKPDTTRIVVWIFTVAIASWSILGGMIIGYWVKGSL